MMRQASSSLGPEADFNYHTNLQLKEVLYSNGVTGTYQRDPDSLVRPYRRTFTGPEGTLYDTGFFGYDGAGNIHSIGVERYTYDGAGRLRKGTVNQAEPDRWEKYRYDAADNLVDIHNDSFGSRPFTVDPQTNRLLRVGPQQSFAYDGAGNTRTALKLPDGRPEYQWTWDAFNMQTRTQRNLKGGGSEHWIYVYGPGDYRLWTEDYTGDEVVFDWKFRGPNGQILQEYEVRRDREVWNHVRDVIHGAEGPLAAYYADGSERYFHTDHLGTPRVITKTDGTKLSEHHYYPYGLEVPSEQEDPVPEGFIFADGFETGDTSRWATPGSPQPPPEGTPAEELSVKYTGHERDLHRSTDYMLARSYAFLLGRFLSVDRVQDGWNRYAYVGNRPVLARDPTGLADMDCTTSVEIDGKMVCTETIDVVEEEEDSSFKGSRDSFLAVLAWIGGALPEEGLATSAMAAELAKTPGMQNIREKYEDKNCEDDRYWTDFQYREVTTTRNLTGQLVGGFVADITSAGGGGGMIVIEAQNTWGLESATRLPGRSNRGNASIQQMVTGSGPIQYPKSILENRSSGPMRTAKLWYVWAEESPCVP